MEQLRPEEQRELRALWPIYFDGEAAFADDDGRLTLIAVLGAFFASPASDPLLSGELKSSRSSYSFDYSKFCDAVPLRDFSKVLHEQPSKSIGCVSLGILVAMRRLNVDIPEETLMAQFVNVKPALPLASVRSNVAGRFVEVTGSIIRASSVRPLVVQVDFECCKCGEAVTKHFVDGNFEYPKRCLTSRCRSNHFEILRDTAVTVDHQRLRLQEMDTECVEAGRVPASIAVELRGPLVDSGVPGDVVRVTGIVSTQNAMLSAGQGGRKALESSIYVLYILANSVENTRSPGSRSDDKVAAALRFSAAELQLVANVARKALPLPLLIASLAPGIRGQELVKMGFLLALAGGTQRASDVPLRSDPHVIVVGDPGMGKSQMLIASAACAPRSVYVCGNTTTATGLTVTAHKDGRDTSLEAGALVLSDQGVCCLDEFDKMHQHHNALLEAMEQQRVSIAKGGVVATLSSRCAILAAANPIGGNYNRGLSVRENLKMSSALLSRFDLVFILVDDPDAERDAMLSRHVMSAHSGHSAESQRLAEEQYSMQLTIAPEEVNESCQDFVFRAFEEETLSSYLRRVCAMYGKRDGEPDTGTMYLPPAMLRKYIAYCKAFCKPRLCPKAARVLQDQFKEMRKGSRQGGVLVTTRQLESLIRLAEARAKLSLREIVTETDAKEVVALMQESMLQAGNEGLGIDFDSGFGLSGKRGGQGLSSRTKSLVKRLHTVAARKRSTLFSTTEVREAAALIGVRGLDFENLLEVMRHECYLLRKGPGLFALQGTSLSQGT